MIYKIQKFIDGWGLTILVALAALVVYFVGINTATNCYNESTAPVQMTIDNDGHLGIKYVYEDHKEVHVLWETDGGNIKPLKEDKNFQNQNTEENKGYFCYTNVLDKAVWSPEDNDGHKYTTANIRALVYEECESQGVFSLQEYFIELYMTVTIDKEGKVVKCEDRYFSNPIREGESKDWSEIYPIFEAENGKITYRYRTGKDIDGTKELYSRWQCNESILSETSIADGYIPEFKTVYGTSNLKALTQINTVTVDTSILNSGKEYLIEAFLVESEHYDKPDLSDEQKIHKAELKLK